MIRQHIEPPRRQERQERQDGGAILSTLFSLTMQFLATLASWRFDIPKDPAETAACTAAQVPTPTGSRPSVLGVLGVLAVHND